MLSTPRVHNSAGTCKDTVTYPGTVPVARARGKDIFGKGKGAYEWGKSNHDGNKGSNYGMHKGGGKANSPSSYGPVKRHQKG